MKWIFPHRVIKIVPCSLIVGFFPWISNVGQDLEKIRDAGWRHLGEKKENQVGYLERKVPKEKREIEQEKEKKIVGKNAQKQY